MEGDLDAESRAPGGRAMIRPTEKSKAVTSLLDRLSPDVQRALAKCGETFEEATALRETFAEHEGPIRKWEQEVRDKAPKGRRWKALFAEVLKALASASNVHEQVSRREKAALSLYRKAIARIRHLAESSDLEVPARSIELLDEVARLRSVELEWLGGVLQHSRVILSLPPSSPADRVLILLEQRQHYMSRVGSLWGESRKLEQQALGPVAVPEATPAGEAETELAPAERLRGVEPAAPGAGRAGGEPAKDEEWDDWLESVQSRTPQGAKETDREKAMGKTAKEGVTEGKVEKAPVETAPVKPAVEPAAVEKKEPPAVAKGSSLTAPFEAMKKELLETVESRLTRTRSEIDGLVEGELKRVQADHDRALSTEVRARQDAEQLGRKLSEDLTKTKDLLTKSEETIVANEKRHKSVLEDERGKSEKMRTDLNGRIDGLKKEGEDLRKRIAALEKADREMRDKVKANDAELASEKKRLEADRAKAKKEVEEADQERDDALVLITSLSRRLKTAGLEEAISRAPAQDKKKA